MPTLGAARYSRTVEKVTVGMSASNSQAEACDIISAMSSCAALGNMGSCSTNGSVHAAFRSTSQSPACHSAAAEHHEEAQVDSASGHCGRYATPAPSEM
jgi:hypothetical protein